MSVCLSHHSTAAAACGGFAAERRAGRRYRLTAAGVWRLAATELEPGAAARRSAANEDSVMLTAELTMSNTDLFNDLFSYFGAVSSESTIISIAGNYSVTVRRAIFL